MALSDCITPAVTELGKIKIGGKDPTERKSKAGGTYRAPMKLDHFVITTMRRDNRGDLIPDDTLMASLARYADPDGKLRELPVAVLSNDPDHILQARYLATQGKRIAAISDGVTLTKFYDSRSNSWLDKPVTSDWDPAFADRKDAKGVPLFKLHTTLNVAIAATSARYGGVYKFRTTSKITASQLYGSILQLRQLTGGVLRGLPLTMVVRPVEVSPEGKTTTVYVVHLEMRGPDLASLQGQARELMRFEIENAQAMRRAEQEYRRLLAAPGSEGEEAEADAIEEFHPETLALPSAPPPAAPASTPSPRRDPLIARLDMSAARDAFDAAVTSTAAVAPSAPAALDDAVFEQIIGLRRELDIQDDEWARLCKDHDIPGEFPLIDSEQGETLLCVLNQLRQQLADDEKAERDAIAGEPAGQ